MISFKEFLFEASTGPEKWEKYFSGSDTETLISKDTPLYTVDNKKTDTVIARGERITVLGAEEDAEYSSRPKILYHDDTYRVPLTNIAKPKILNKSVTINLKPDAIGITGDFDMTSFVKDIKKIIDEHKEIPSAQGEYLKALIGHAEDIRDSELADIAAEAFTASGTATDAALKNTINTGFMEILGPLFVAKEKSEYKNGTCFFPTAGNQPLYDFIMRDADGVEMMCSSKKSTGSVNTLKVSNLVPAFDTAPDLKRKYKREYDLIMLIHKSKIKDAPNEMNRWLAATFPTYKAAPEAKTPPELYRLEADTIKWINTSNLDFREIVDVGIPELMYVKAKLNSDGTLAVEPLRQGADHTKLKFRSKNSSNRMSDKIGLIV